MIEESSHGTFMMELYPSFTSHRIRALANAVSKACKRVCGMHLLIPPAVDLFQSLMVKWKMVRVYAFILESWDHGLVIQHQQSNDNYMLQTYKPACGLSQDAICSSLIITYLQLSLLKSSFSLSLLVLWNNPKPSIACTCNSLNMRGWCLRFKATGWQLFPRLSVCSYQH